MKHFFRMAQVHRAWRFYREQLLDEAAGKGWPVARHMMLVFPGSHASFTCDLGHQFMLGTEILVAPVHIKGGDSVSVFLPQNTTWIHAWTNHTYQGNMLCAHRSMYINVWAYQVNNSTIQTAIEISTPMPLLLLTCIPHN